MAPISEREFRQRLASLSATAFADFVVDLWTTRGLEPRRAGDLVVARDPLVGGEQSLYPLSAAEGAGAVPDDADEVVTAGTDPDLQGGTTTVDAAELHQITCYGVDRAARDRLLDEHLGYDPERGPAAERFRTSAPGDGDDRPDSTASDSTTDDSTDDGGGSTRRDALAAGGGALLAAGALGAVLWRQHDGTWPIVGGSSPGGGPEGRRTSTGLPSDRLAPGLSEAGVVEPSTLADAHTDTLVGKSYVLESERRVQRADGALSSSLRVSVALADDRTFLARLETSGPDGPLVLGTPPARATFWSDGERYLRRFSRESGTTYNTFRPPDEYVGTWQYWVRTVPFGGGYGGPERFYADIFGGVPTRIAGRSSGDGPTTYQVEQARSTPRRRSPAFALDVDDVATVSLDALVDERGLVPSLHLGHEGTVAADAEATATGTAQGTPTADDRTTPTADDRTTPTADDRTTPTTDTTGTSTANTERTQTTDAGEARRPVVVEWTVHYRDVGATTVGRPSWYERAVDG